MSYICLSYLLIKVACPGAPCGTYNCGVVVLKSRIVMVVSCDGIFVISFSGCEWFHRPRRAYEVVYVSFIIVDHFGDCCRNFIYYTDRHPELKIISDLFDES